MTASKRNPYIIILIMILCLAAFSEISPLFGANIGYFHESLWFQTYENPLFGTACLGSIFAYWLLLPFQKREFIVFTVIGIIIEAILIKYRLEIIGPIGQLLHIGPGLLSGAILAILWRILRCLKEQDQEALTKCLEVLSLSISMPVLLSLGASVRSYSDLNVYDPYCYALDSLWGGQISFILSKFLRSSLIWRLPMYIIYFYLSLYMVLAQIFVYKYNDEHRQDHSKCLIPAFFFIIIAICGSSLYIFFPVVGVEVYCGLNLFPNGPWPEANLNPTPIEAPAFLVRNGMPSLHLSWILAVYYSLYRAKPIYKNIALVLVVLTALSAFSVGCHYLIDLIIAIPFTMALLAIVTPDASNKIRLIGAIFGTVTVLGWLCIFKYSITSALQNPTITLTLLVITDIVALYLAHLICSQTKKTEETQIQQPLSVESEIQQKATLSPQSQI